jgi:hypothetical protein
MTLKAKDKLICDLIKENPDATIKDYIEVCTEVMRIEKASGVVIAESKIVKGFINRRRDLSRMHIG